MSVRSSVVDTFRLKFNVKPTVVCAPARINFMGEHVDYNDGFVLPAAIDREMIFAIAPSGHDRCNIYSLDLDEGVSFSIHDLNAGDTWVNYLMGVLDGFERMGLPVHGVDCVFAGNIPLGAGLSSSAALCCGFGFALNELFQCNLTKVELAKLAQYAEHEFVGLRCGIMDQYASLLGVKNSALLLDCRVLSHRVVPIDLSHHAVLLIDSKVKHALASSAYNERREACEEGVRVIHQKNETVHSLRDVSPQLLRQHQHLMSTQVFAKCKFVVEEIMRTQAAANHLQKNELVSVGKLMYQTHKGLSENYEVSCPEL
ncbi:MAG: galactokinase, partial [Flammeovirgaceae bacterium]